MTTATTTNTASEGDGIPRLLGARRHIDECGDMMQGLRNREANRVGRLLSGACSHQHLRSGPCDGFHHVQGALGRVHEDEQAQYFQS
jgi:hypothetical protein